MSSNQVEMFARNLRYLRKRKKMSQEELGSFAEITQSQISKYERNELIPSLDVAVKICDGLGVSIGEMVDSDIITFIARTRKNADDIRTGAKYPYASYILNRFEKIVLYCYYFSDENTELLYEGKITLGERCGITGNFVVGKMTTNSQSYKCKLVVEHPRYICIYGENYYSPERMFMVINEPRFNLKGKKYSGGIALTVSESKKQEAFAQKVVLSSASLDYMNARTRDEIVGFLRFINSTSNGIKITKEEDKRYYEWLKMCSKKQ